MAYNALNNLIDAYIYANGVQAITGQILNGVLKQMVSQLGSGYHLMGVAGPETVPASNDYAMAYFAATAGEYTDFGGITLAAGEVAVLLTSGNGSWSKQTIYNVPTTTEDLENTANFITNAVTDLVNYYTKTEVDDTLANYPTLEALATALADYYTKQEIDTTLEDYPTKQDQETALGDYYTKDEMNAALGDRYTKSETDTKLEDYYKKVETYDKDEVDSIVAALSRQEYIIAWDGSSAPVVADIPAGVTVTYNATPYTGTLAASASTVNKIYMVWNGVAYDMYGTSQDGGYSWVPMGTTSVDLSQYATKAELSQLEHKVQQKKAYFAASARPTFSDVVVNGGSSTITITFPSNTFRIYDDKGTVLVNTDDYNGQSFIIASFKRLVYDWDTDTISIVELNTTGNYEDLFVVASDAFTGLLAPYFYNTRIADNLTTNDANKALSAKQGKVLNDNLVSLTRDASPKKAYFAASARPTFSDVVVNGGSSTITITFPSNTFRLYNSAGTAIVETDDFGGQSFTIPSFKRLVYDWSNNTIAVVDLNANGIYTDLFVVSSDAFSGLLAPFYYNSKKTPVYELAEKANNIISKDKLVQFFLIRSNRNVYFEENDSTGVVYFKYPGVLNVRGGGVTKQYYMQELATELNVSLVTSTNGVADCIGIPNVNSLVYDTISNTMKLKHRDNILSTDIILIQTSSGTIIYIKQGFFNAYDIITNNAFADSTDIVKYYKKDKVSLENVAKGSDACFLFFSDIHGQDVNMRRIVMLANSLGTSKVKAIINGGDTVTQLLDNGLTWYDNIVDISDIDVISCCGNHDVWSDSTWHLANRTDVYSAVIAPVVSKVANIVQPIGASANGDCYYYKDYGDIRIIVLCAMVESPSSQMFWDSAQSSWMQSVLADAKTNGKYVICVNHAPFAKADAELVTDTKWTSYIAKMWKDDTEHQVFDSIHTSPEAVENVYNFIEDGGNFICWLTGHLHIDSIQKITSKQQMMINISSANNNNHSDGYKTNIESEYLYDCFNYIGIDKTNHFLKIFRIGWNMDASMRVRNILNYDYVNKTIVTEN